MKIKQFFKTVPGIILAIALISVTGYALLTYYITITGSATVQQSVKLDAIESTWEYEWKPYEKFGDGITSVDLGNIIVVGGDEQDIGIWLSNYAEVKAPITISKKVIGPVDSKYEPCKDDVVTIYTDFDYNEESPTYQHCMGEPIPTICEEIDSRTAIWTSDVVALPSRDGIGDVSHNWFCIRNAWSLAAVPGKYWITITVNPAILEWRTLILENKDPVTWQIIDDGVKGTLTYRPACSEFEYEFEATGLAFNTKYSLIYYADFEDRFANWGGNNLGALIGIGISDGSGKLSMSDSIDLDMNLPSLPDANIYIHDYFGPPDNYAHAHGAKVWLVPSSDYDIGLNKVTNWNPTKFLFETDLITYFDSDL